MTRRLWPQTIRGQMMAIIFGAIALVSVVGDTTEAMLKRQRDGIMDTEDYAQSVSVLSRMLAAAPPDRRSAEIARWRAVGIGAELIRTQDLRADPDRHWLRERLADTPDAMPPGFAAINIDGKLTLTFALDADQSILFTDVPQYLLDTKSIYFLAALLALAAGFSALAIRGIAAPARRMADTMQRTDWFLAGGAAVKAEGPRELRALAHAMNDMRDRIRHLLDSRSAMLRSVSHDLRTPLTRLRLRIERIEDADLRASARSDVAQIDTMIETTLDYLRDGAASLTFERCDIASVLATICDDFADTGGAIAYDGPRRIAMDASVTELTRAIANLCDNGLKFANTVTVRAEETDARVIIHVLDDGPGIPPHLREKVMEPYVKLDSSRAGGGFGLGLSIAAEIVARHGGNLHLLANDPRGLHVRLSLPRFRAD